MGRHVLWGVCSVEAIILVKNVRGMCRAGCFRLTKFASNSKELLNVNPTKRQVTRSSRFQRLLETIPDNEGALCVHWNIADDKLGFQVHMKEKPLTR